MSISGISKEQGTQFFETAAKVGAIGGTIASLTCVVLDRDATYPATLTALSVCAVASIWLTKLAHTRLANSESENRSIKDHVKDQTVHELSRKEKKELRKRKDAAIDVGDSAAKTAVVASRSDSLSKPSFSEPVVESSLELVDSSAKEVSKLEEQIDLETDKKEETTHEMGRKVKKKSKKRKVTVIAVGDTAAKTAVVASKSDNLGKSSFAEPIVESSLEVASSATEASELQEQIDLQTDERDRLHSYIHRMRREPLELDPSVLWRASLRNKPKPERFIPTSESRTRTIYGPSVESVIGSGVVEHMMEVLLSSQEEGEEPPAELAMLSRLIDEMKNPLPLEGGEALPGQEA